MIAVAVNLPRDSVDNGHRFVIGYVVSRECGGGVGEGEKDEETNNRDREVSKWSARGKADF